MFERYTEKARRAIFFARYEASVWGSQYIEPQHLLLGLLREDEELFSDLLQERTLVETAAEEMGLKTRTGIMSSSIDLPLSQEASRVLAYSSEEAQRLDGQVASGHFLLGLLREPGPARDLLEKRGLQSAAVRDFLSRIDSTLNSQLTSEQVVAELRKHFEGMTARLTPELEPAVSYDLHEQIPQ
jgi:ATP-dependent Clp protease ATP-binding subunit ClpC